jgi:hypothetical protein
MKGSAQQSKQLTLGDVAYVYQGIGTRDLKLGQEPGEGFVDCWAVGASAIDATSSKLNRSHYVRGSISKRLIDNPLRGSGQLAKLQGQEILIANRGNYKVSNLVGLTDSLESYHEYLPVYPAATVLVVRPKEKYEWPWRLLAFLDSPQTREILLRSASGADGEGRVITKADLEALTLPPNYLTIDDRFHAKTRASLERLEELDVRLSKLRRAEIQTKAWRELHAPQDIPAYLSLNHEAFEAIPGWTEVNSQKLDAHLAYSQRAMALSEDSSTKVMRGLGDPALETLGAEAARLEEKENIICLEFIRDLLVTLREHNEFTEGQKQFADAFKKAHGLNLTPEAIHGDPRIGQILAEPIDAIFVSEGLSSAIRMTQGVMELMGALAKRFKSLVVLNPGAGHLPHVIARMGGPMVSVVPTLSYGSQLLPFAKAYGQLASGRAVFTYGSLDAFTKAVDRREDFQWKRGAVIADVGATGSSSRLFKEALEKISPGIDEQGVCLAYVAADQFPKILALLNKVISLTVLPPLPANLKAPKAVLAQGLLVEFALNKTQPRGVVVIFDATRMVPVEKVGHDLDDRTITVISKAINDDTSVEGVLRSTVKREDFVLHQEWPGLIALLGSSYDMLMAATPETIHDERRCLDREKRLLDEQLLKEDESGLIFPRMPAATEAQPDKDSGETQ